MGDPKSPCFGTNRNRRQEQRNNGNPKLAESANLKGCIVTIDAMGTQTAIATAIIDKKADYILTVKDNQPTLRSDIQEFFETDDIVCDRATTLEDSHGRIERRELLISRDIAWLDPEGKWKGLSGIGKLTTETEILSTGKKELAVSYIIFSCPELDAAGILKAKRAHWGIENGLHWRLDVAFREDQSRARVENAAIIFNLLRHMAMNLISLETTSKGGVDSKQYRCANSVEYLLKVLNCPTIQ